MKPVKIHKFGSIAALAATDDIWSGSNSYPFPAAAAATTAISGDDEDGGAGGDTGALTIRVIGLDADYLEVSQDIILNGTTVTAAFTTPLIRCYRAWVLTVGAGATGTNIGAIDIKHGSTIIAQIPVGLGQTQMAIYTVPADYTLAYIKHWDCTAHGLGATASADFSLQVKEFGGAWKQIEKMGISSGMGGYHQTLEQKLGAKADIRIRCTATASITSASASFDIELT